MNKLETVKKIAGLSGVNEVDSCKVLDALEVVFQAELSRSGGWRYTLNAGGTVAMTLVPPLLFIPFIRYAIEDAGAEQIEIELNATESTVDFSCRYIPAESASAVDFRQIRQRLTLLYKEHFRLSVNPSGGIQLHLKMQDNDR